MALPASKASNDYGYHCNVPNATPLSGRRDGELSDKLRKLKLDVESHFVTPELLATRVQRGNLIIFSDYRKEFELSIIGEMGAKKGLNVTLRYPKQYGELNGSTHLDQYGFKIIED
jgi:hypothetical protein